jgi:hypothetical protein
MAIIEKYRYGLSKPSGDKDQVNCMISIDIARFDSEAANRPDNSNGLPSSCRKLKLDPVVGTRKVALAGLNAGYIRAKVPVKILNCNLWARPDRSDRSTLNLCGLRRSAACESKQQQQSNPQKQAAQRPAFIP